MGNKRTAMTVLREIQTVKSQVDDPALRAQLLAPLFAEVEAIAKFNAAQGVLPLSGEVPGDVKSAKK